MDDGGARGGFVAGRGVVSGAGGTARRGLVLPPRIAGILHRRLGLRLVLALGLGGLMLLGVGSVLFVSVGGASRNTTALLRDKADLILSSIEQRVRDHLDPAMAQATYLRTLIEAGELDPDDRAGLGAALRGALAATPQVTGAAFVASDGRVTRVDRGDRRVLEEDWSDRAEIRALLAHHRGGGATRWGAPVWSPAFERTILPITAPVYRGGALVGIIVPAIFIAELSRYVAEFSTPAHTAFILYGRDRVVAHPGLVAGGPPATREAPLPRVDAVGDRVLASIWRVDGRLRFPLRPGDSGHIVEVPGDYYVVITRPLAGYGAEPWIVGAALAGSEVGEEYARLMRIAGISTLLLLIAVAGAVYVAGRLARPIADLVRLTEAVQRLDLRDAPRLPRSRIRELDAAGQSLNGMVSALRWFELYLPRRLVRALLARGGDALVNAREREVSVLFTDICGFSRLAARMSPAETGAFLNEHFGLLGSCVEAEAGTIDKYIGDSVMAFWGAPDEQPDHADRACRTALSIAAAIRADNEVRRARGLDPVRIRIGVGTGRVLVGNIGASGRVNYTLVGDVVNLAQRVEQLGREIAPDAEVVALITEDSHCRLAGRSDAVLIARRELRDRDGVIGVYRLV